MRFYSNPMTAFDWLMAIGYLAVIAYGLYWNAEVVVWVWLYVSYRDYVNKNLADKTLGDANKGRG